MSKVDILFLALFAIAAIMGFRKGFIAQVVMFVALLVGIWACLKFSNFTAEYLAEHFEFARTSDRATTLWAFGVTFSLTVLLVYLLGAFASRTLKALLLGWVNRMLGLIFGVLKLALILSVLISALSYGHVLERVISAETQQQSLFFQPVSRFAPAVYPKLRKYGQKALDGITIPNDETQATPEAEKEN